MSRPHGFIVLFFCKVATQSPLRAASVCVGEICGAHHRAAGPRILDLKLRPAEGHFLVGARRIKIAEEVGSAVKFRIHHRIVLSLAEELNRRAGVAFSHGFIFFDFTRGCFTVKSSCSKLACCMLLSQQVEQMFGKSRNHHTRNISYRLTIFFPPSFSLLTQPPFFCDLP